MIVLMEAPCKGAQNGCEVIVIGVKNIQRLLTEVII